MKVLHVNFGDSGGGANIAAHRIFSSILNNGVSSSLAVVEKVSNDNNIISPYNSSFYFLISKNLRRLQNKFYLFIYKFSGRTYPISCNICPTIWPKFINNSDADIVNLHWIGSSMISISDIGKIKKPTVWTLHDMWAFSGVEHFSLDYLWVNGYDNKFDLNRLVWKLKKKYWKNQIHIVAPSQWLKKCANESILMRGMSVTVIPNPINTDVWCHRDKNSARTKFNLPKNEFLILFGAVGGIKNPYKGFNLLQESLEYICKNYKDINFSIVLFGGDQTSNIDGNCSKKYYSVGKISSEDEMIELYSAVDLYVHPSKIDNFPNTVLEAQSIGVPVVAFNIGGIPDIVEHMVTGYLAVPFDTKDFANGIKQMVQNSQKSIFSNNARKNVIEKFSSKVISDKYINLYREILISDKK